MTCKDCIHYEACKELRYGDISNCDSKDCGGHFKNKADYVEVVRCKDCKHGDVGTFSMSMNAKENIACYCELDEAVTDIDWYCPRGERK